MKASFIPKFIIYIIIITFETTATRDLEIITVGQSTANEAKKLGFENVTSAAIDDTQSASVSNLINYIITNIPRDRPIQHISANITKGELGKRLKSLGYKYNREILYQSIQRDFSEEFIKKIRNGEFTGFTFFSPRTAAIFSKQIFKGNLNSCLYQTVAFCFSENVILGLRGLDLAKIYIPEVTNSENFVKTISDYSTQELC